MDEHWFALCFGKKEAVRKKRGMLPFAALFPLYCPGTRRF
ncbi:hypothetical protein B4099_3485 [Heyndrickxia coagulans]|uniref:Uncharacterized protein n=1 Tax=Heyndrickxia coagulans TaxID=1398 RepID=A0A150K8G0_HEYCO|nr:hypothetical protein B4099_3485 [Heyndrickxia coagulans]